MKKLLFLCSRNQWRSPTAEALFRGSQLYQARSAGTQPSARVRVSAQLLRWADMVFVMQRHHNQKMLQQFAQTLQPKPPVVRVVDTTWLLGAEVGQVGEA